MEKKETIKQSFTLKYLQFHRVKTLEEKNLVIRRCERQLVTDMFVQLQKEGKEIADFFLKVHKAQKKFIRIMKSSVQQHVRIQEQYAEKGASKSHLRLKTS